MKTTSYSYGGSLYLRCQATSLHINSLAERRTATRRTRVSYAKDSLKRSVVVRTTTDVDSHTMDEEKVETFNWFKYWWPVQLMYNLDTDRPNRIQLLGEYFVAWKDKSGEWVVMKDMCPHRLAPLSEGRIEEDGTLMCSYHGWRFVQSGKCVKIPQADDEKSHESACNNPRSCAMTYPCKEFARMLWVWPDAESFEEAKNTPLPIPDDHAAALERSAEAGMHPGFTRDVPYGFSTMMENVVDPSHFPFSHHGTFFGTRDMGRPLDMKIAEPLFPGSIVSVAHNDHGSDNPVRLEVVAPNSVWYQYGEFGEGKSWTRNLNFIVPMDANKTRFTTLRVSSGNFYRKPSLSPYTRLLSRFPWLFHLAALPILDGDNVFLHIQDQYLKEVGDKWSPQTYFMPTSADTAVIRYKQWLLRKGGGGPQMKNETHELSRRELLDRYSSHVSFCKICQGGLRFLNKATAICQVLGTCSLILAVGLLARSFQGTLAFWKTALSFVPFILFSLMQKYIKEKMIPQFYFVDYVHAEKN